MLQNCLASLLITAAPMSSQSPSQTGKANVPLWAGEPAWSVGLVHPGAQHHVSTALDRPSHRPQGMSLSAAGTARRPGSPFPGGRYSSPGTLAAPQRSPPSLRADERVLEHREGCPPRAFGT